MTGPARSRRSLAAAVLALAAAACTALPAPEAPRPAEGVLGGKKGKVGVQIKGSHIQLTLPPGLPAGGLALVVGGRVLKPDAKGGLALPSELLAAARAGDVLVLGPGLAPRRLDPAASTVELAPATPIAGGVAGAAPIAGGGLALALPAGAVAAGTPVGVSTYDPEARAAWHALAEADRQALAAGACDAPLPCPPPAVRLGLLVAVDGPLRPGALSLTLDLGAWLRGWDGQGAPPWDAAPDAWGADDRTRAQVAARVLETYAAIDGSADPGLRDRLARLHGVSLADRRLTLAVPVGAEGVAAGLVRTEVWGSLLLGVGLEVTILSSVRGDLPGGLSAAVGALAGTTPAAGTASPLALVPPVGDGGGLIGKAKDPAAMAIRGYAPRSWLALGGGAVLARGGDFISDAGGALISDGGGGLISNNGGGVVSNNGGTLVSDHGGGLVGGPFGPPKPDQVAGLAPNAGRIEGTVTGPFNGAKYMLAALFPLVPYGATEVVLPYVDGAPTATTDVDGRFVLAGIPPTASHVVVATRHEGQVLLTICPAPRGAGEVQRADLNPDTTAAAAATLFWLGGGCASPAELQYGEFLAATSRVGATLTLEAHMRVQGLLYQPVPGPGAAVEDLMGTTFMNKTLALSAFQAAWLPIATVQAGQRVGFAASGTTYNGTVDSGPLGAPNDNFWGAIKVRGPGWPEQTIPIGRTVAMPAAGTVEARYYDLPGQFGDNGGAYQMQLWVSGCP